MVIANLVQQKILILLTGALISGGSKYLNLNLNLTCLIDIGNGRTVSLDHGHTQSSVTLQSPRQI